MSHLCESKDLAAPYGPSPAGASTIADDIWGMFGVVSTVLSVISSIATIVGFVVGGPTVAMAALLGTVKVLAIGSGFAVTLVALVYLNQLCLSNPQGPLHCVAGIVSRIVARAADPLFTFNTLHPYFDIVTSCRYWRLVIASGDPDFILYNTDSPEGSPVLRAYIYSQSVCDIVGWSTAGTAVGATVGVLAFDAISTAAAAACAATGPFCLIFALLAAIIAAIIAAVVGGWLFGTIADAASSGDASDNFELSGEGVLMNQLVTVKGTLVQSGFDGGANVFWFVQRDDAPEAVPPSFGTWGFDTTPYSHEDADAVFIIDQDDGSEEYLEDAFCGRTDLACVDFLNREAGDVLNSPTDLYHGWSIATEAGGSMSIVSWGAPEDTAKLFVESGAVRITFDQPVVSVTAEVGWAGGDALNMTGYTGNTEVGSAQAPEIQNMVHTLTLTAASIDSILVSAQEGLIIRICAEYA